MESCPAFATGLGYVPDILALLDCKADILARSGFETLAATGSPTIAVIGGMMTLMVAFYGYRLILGGTPDFSDIMISMVKVGLVLAFATQWPAYRAVFHDVTVKGPQELLVRLPFEILDDPDQYPARIQASYDRLVALEMPQRLMAATSGPANITPSSDPYASAQLPPTIDVTYGDVLAFRPASAGLFLLFPALVALALPRLVAALLLALGPLFIGFLLFDATRNIFLGWVRVLGWSIIGGTITSILIGIELSIVEPQITQLASDLASGISGLHKTGELLATTLLFVALLAASFIAAIAPTRLAVLSVKIFSKKDQECVRSSVADERQIGVIAQHHNVEALRSRAQLIGDRMALAASHDDRVRQLQSVREPGSVGERIMQPPRAENISPLGQSYRHSASSRRIPNAAKRTATR